MPQIGEQKRTRINKPYSAQGWGYRYFIWMACPECKKEHWVDKYHIKHQRQPGLCFPCSSYCQQGERSYNWKGGRHKTTAGYIKMRVARNDFFYPMVGKKGYILEHRLVIAKHLNRCLLPWEVVHHKNGIKDDNRIENLQLLPTNRYHLPDNCLRARIKELEKEIERLKNKGRLASLLPQWFIEWEKERD